MQTGPGVLLICRIAVVIAWQRLFRGRCANVQNVHNGIDRYFPDLSYEELMKRSPDLVFLVLVESVRSCTAWIGTKWHFAMLFNWALRAPYGLILWLQDHVDNLHELSTFPLLLIQLHDPSKRPWIGHSMSEPQKKTGGDGQNEIGLFQTTLNICIYSIQPYFLLQYDQKQLIIIIASLPMTA